MASSKNKRHDTPRHDTTSAPAEAPSARFVDLPIDEFTTNVDRIVEHVNQIRALVPNPTRYTPEQRKHSGGRLKDGEGPMLKKVLEVVRKYPAAFESLGNLDYGTDPNAFEVDLVDERLTKTAKLVPLVEALLSLVQDISDCMLDLNETGRAPALEAYVIAKALARGNPVVSAMIADVIGYYAAKAKAAAATRKAKSGTSAAPGSVTPKG